MTSGILECLSSFCLAQVGVKRLIVSSSTSCQKFNHNISCHTALENGETAIPVTRHMLTSLLLCLPRSFAWANCNILRSYLCIRRFLTPRMVGLKNRSLLIMPYPREYPFPAISLIATLKIPQSTAFTALLSASRRSEAHMRYLMNKFYRGQTLNIVFTGFLLARKTQRAFLPSSIWLAQPKACNSFFAAFLRQAR